MIKSKNQAIDFTIYEKGDIDTILTDVAEHVDAVETSITDRLDVLEGNSPATADGIASKVSRADMIDGKIVNSISVTQEANAVVLNHSSKDVSDVVAVDASGTVSIAGASTTAAGIMTADDKVELSAATADIADEIANRVDEVERLDDKIDTVDTRVTTLSNRVDDDFVTLTQFEGSTGIGSKVDKTAYDAKVAEIEGDHTALEIDLHDNYYTKPEIDSQVLDVQTTITNKETSILSEVDARIDASRTEIEDGAADTYHTVDAFELAIADYYNKTEIEQTYESIADFTTAIADFIKIEDAEALTTPEALRDAVNKLLYGDDAVPPQDVPPNSGFVQDFLRKQYYDKVETEDEVVKAMWGYLRRNAFKKAAVPAEDGTDPIPNDGFRWVHNEDAVVGTPETVKISQTYTNPHIEYYLPSDPQYDPDNVDKIKTGPKTAKKTLTIPLATAPDADTSYVGTAGIVNAETFARFIASADENEKNLSIDDVQPAAHNDVRIENFSFDHLQTDGTIKSDTQLKINVKTSAINADADEATKHENYTVILGEAVAPDPDDPVIPAGRVGIVTPADKVKIDAAPDISNFDGTVLSAIELDQTKQDTVSIDVDVDTITSDAATTTQTITIASATPADDNGDDGTAGLLSAVDKNHLDHAWTMYDSVPETTGIVNQPSGKRVSCGILSVAPSSDWTKIYIKERIQLVDGGQHQDVELEIPIASANGLTPYPGLMTSEEKVKLAGMATDLSDLAMTEKLVRIVAALEPKFVFHDGLDPDNDKSAADNLGIADHPELAGPCVEFYMQDAGGQSTTSPGWLDNAWMNNLIATVDPSVWISNTAFMEAIAKSPDFTTGLFDTEDSNADSFVNKAFAADNFNAALGNTLLTNPAFVDNFFREAFFERLVEEVKAGENPFYKKLIDTSGGVFWKYLFDSNHEGVIDAILAHPKFGDFFNKDAVDSVVNNKIHFIPAIVNNASIVSGVATNDQFQFSLVNDPEFIEMLRAKLNNLEITPPASYKLELIGMTATADGTTYSQVDIIDPEPGVISSVGQVIFEIPDTVNLMMTAVEFNLTATAVTQYTQEQLASFNLRDEPIVVLTASGYSGDRKYKIIVVEDYQP
jgi:hypothetical protein